MRFWGRLAAGARYGRVGAIRWSLGHDVRLWLMWPLERSLGWLSPRHISRWDMTCSAQGTSGRGDATLGLNLKL